MGIWAADTMEACMEDRFLAERHIAELSAAQREDLLRRSWMANDGLWFYRAFTDYGHEVANTMNVAVVHEFGRLEMRRLMRELGITQVTSWQQYRELFTLAAGLYVGDLFSYDEEFVSGVHHIRVKTCFAYTGVARAGVAEVYHCGPFERVRGWFQALKLTVTISPEVGLCQMAHSGQCGYSLSVELSQLLPPDSVPATGTENGTPSVAP